MPFVTTSASRGGTRGLWTALTRSRLEIAVGILLLLTAGAIRYGDALLNHSVVITPKEASDYIINWHGDEAVGGSSTVSADPAHPLTWSCALRPKYQYPFCGYEILFDKGANRGLDLSRFQTITLTVDYRGPADSIRLSLKNYDPRYSDPRVRETTKFNQVELPLKHRRQVLKARLTDFNVAEWWIQKNRVPFRYSRPQFDNIVALEIETGNGAHPGLHRFRVDSITLSGGVLSIEQWYLAILGCWIALICLFLIARIIGLQRDLRSRRVLHDVAQNEVQRAKEHARHDHLTGLLNRLGATDRYRQLLMAGGGKPVAIMLIDVDHFKSINDRFGHTLGDEVLCAFAAVLRHHTRDDDLIARWGGEEFLLIGRVNEAHAAVEIANKLRAVIEANDFGIHGKLTASFGVYHCEAAPDTLGEGVSLADRALYQAKEQGRNRVVLYHP